MNESNFDGSYPSTHCTPDERRHEETKQRQRLNEFVAPDKSGDESELQPCSITPWSQESVENFQTGRRCEEDDGEDSDDGIEIIGVVHGNASQAQVQEQAQTNFPDSARYQVSRNEYSGSFNQSNLHVQSNGQPGYYTSSSSVRFNGYPNYQKPHPQQGQRKMQFLTPYRIDLKNHEPTWENLWPKLEIANPAPLINTTNQIRAYKLSLLSHTEFTVTAVMHHTNRYDFIPSLMGLRRPIKEITRVHAREGEKAILEEGKWRVPLSVYQIFYGYLCNQSNTEVEGIPASQLNIASMGRASAERGYPSPEDLIDSGVPPSLAYSLAPYQRGGVDFVLQRGGKALIADEMGLGKTVQSISAMACYESEWPLLVLSPSTARYHWEAEFLNWLGGNQYKKGPVNSTNDAELHVGSPDNIAPDMSHNGKRKQHNNEEMNSVKRKRNPTMRLLDPCEINVVSSSNDCILKPYTRVVILSYGLVTNLIKKNLLAPGLFKCIIVDESHMLKNKKSKRTMNVMPILKCANRIVMLSGTPALSKPKELFPQLNALGEVNGWWDDEDDFNAKYANDRYSDPSFAELHTLLTSTVMIRRLKKDILRDMPHKIRENVFVKVRDPLLGQQIAEGLLILRDGKGVLGKLSLLYQDLEEYRNARTPAATTDQHYDQNSKVDVSQGNINSDVYDPASRKAILNKMFHLTGTAKIPILIDMLKKWIDDSRNGKLCIFAHHMNVLDALIEKGGLSNHEGSSSKYIRIDGSTHPKMRQEQIMCFQYDPSVRIAVLGITAAGVGVTLTAASTIWFAELFWTPAIMIQAEDRCHRIGQQAQVKCLYITAKDTLDEVLWILLKRKFRALGEFVEGKEKLDMVIHKTYADEFDAVAGKYETNLVSDFDNDDKKNAAYDLVNEDSIQHDIEELASDDLKISVALDDDYAIDDVILSDDRETSLGQKDEDHIICLSDDENDEKLSNDSPYSESMGCDELLNCLRVTQNFTDLKIHGTTKLRNAQFFYAFFHSPKYCTIFSQFFGRFFVHMDFGSFRVGDLVVGLNQWVLKNGEDYAAILNYLAQSSVESPIRICFCRDESFSLLVRDWFDHRERMLKSRHASTTTALENDRGKSTDDKNSIICLTDE